MVMDRAWFTYLDNFHNYAESKWMRTPYMLWINRAYVGDPLGSTLATGADPQPVLECITGTGNVLRVIGENTTHYEIYALPINESPTNYNPKQFNWYNYPWVFWKAQARTRDGRLQNVGAGLDVFHLNFRKPQNRHWIHKSHFTLFRKPPFEAIYGNSLYLVVDYMFLGASVYGIASNGVRIPLMISEKPGQREFPTDWRHPGYSVIPPV
jgi:hypothetical protein